MNLHDCAHLCCIAVKELKTKSERREIRAGVSEGSDSLLLSNLSLSLSLSLSHSEFGRVVDVAKSILKEKNKNNKPRPSVSVRLCARARVGESFFGA
jgi:hypothetical protein